MDKQFVPVIGKDIIESLTHGMYEDSRFIFREYIQNSADQIDKAIREGLINKNEGEIHIHIDPIERTIIIEDNATGIEKDKVQPILQNIAQSTKQRGVDKGFRGIGRLGGLAYCEKLVFETSFKGENFKSRLIWEAATLKDIINNRTEKEDAISVINEVTTLELLEEAPEKHYFKVILEDVTHDDLLDKKEVERYLSMVAPLPYPTRFIYKTEIYKEIQLENFMLDEYKIFLNTEQLFKGYSTIIYKGDDNDRKKDDEVIDIVFFKEYAENGELLFWGWHSVSEKNQSLNQVNYSRGFRLRKSNIQIGDEYTLLKLHRDRRFHFYFFGEVHGIHFDLIPNSRRDNFTENDIYFEFEKKLKSYFHTQIHKLCYTASEINSSMRRIEELKTFEVEYNKKSSNGFTDYKEREEYIDQFEKKKENAIKAKKKIEKIEQDAKENELFPVQKILNRVTMPLPSSQNNVEEPVLEDTKPKFRTDNLSSLSKEQRKFTSKIFTIIRNVLPHEVSENLIQKIEEELS